MRFVDIFAGLGGFHLALRGLGHECVFACEIDPVLQEVYERNFGMRPEGDIRDVVDEVPDHDILCAGFPCQPYSKAGLQEGNEHPKLGDLFERVVDVLRSRQPKYFLIENVPNLERHRRRQTWKAMERSLRKVGYDVDTARLSPHQFGIPQIRDRLYIVGVRTEDGSEGRAADDWFPWPVADPNGQKPDIRAVLDSNPSDAREISDQAHRCLEVWQMFLSDFPSDGKLPSFPIWSMEFGADYPFAGQAPHQLSSRALARYRGSHGQPLRELSPDSRLSGLPSYARRDLVEFPRWKKTFIRQNRELYEDHRDWLDRWIPKIAPFPPSYQKFEWNCQGEPRNIWDYVIQFRASGVRVKRPTTAPALVAMTSTQVPIIAWERRYMTIRECARLQSMSDLEHMPSSETRAFSALGNSINVELVRSITTRLLRDTPSSLLVASRQFELTLAPSRNGDSQKSPRRPHTRPRKVLTVS